MNTLLAAITVNFQTQVDHQQVQNAQIGKNYQSLMVEY